MEAMIPGFPGAGPYPGPIPCSGQTALEHHDTEAWPMGRLTMAYGGNRPI
jgi:hypothetical protein